MSKPEVVAYMWEHRGRHACVDRAYAEQLMDDGEQVAPLIRLTDHERLQAEVERLQAAREAAIAELQADRDQQYDMKVKAREQRDVVTAENQRLRKALTRHVCTGMTDAQRTAELERYLSDGIAADKARIKLLEEQRDSFTMHKMASRQCIGIPASVGVCEPVEGFAERPQDLAPAMRQMALIIEADKARIAELESALSECAPVMRAHAGASHMLEGFKPRRNEWDDLCDRIDEALSQQGKEGEA